MLFAGKDNSVYMIREYFLEYSCQFDLTYYPFDTQMCQMDFEVQGKTDNWLKVMVDGVGVEFLCKKFEILDVVCSCSFLNKLSSSIKNPCGI